jgi:hypothetical protein
MRALCEDKEELPLIALNAGIVAMAKIAINPTTTKSSNNVKADIFHLCTKKILPEIQCFVFCLNSE